MAYSYKELDIWRLSMQITKQAYTITSTFPSNETFALTSQIRRAAVSIPSNIAEGSSRRTTKEFIHFLFIANGSLSEIETQLELSLMLGYTHDNNDIQMQINRLRVMLRNMIISLQQKL